MALNIKVEDGLPITADQACTLLQNETDNFGLFIDLDRCLEYRLAFEMKCNEILERYRKFNPRLDGEDLSISQSAKIRDWFKLEFDIPEHLFYNKANKVSFDKTIRAAMLDANIPDEAKDFLRILNEYNYYSYRINNTLAQYLRAPISYCVSDKGHRMCVINPTWGILSTGRLAASNPSIQNIARDMGDIVCCPKGWTLIRCDSGQIEPRITYSHYIQDPLIPGLIQLYDDAYYGMLHYCQLPAEVFQNRFKYRVAKPDETGNDPMVIYKKEITDEMKAGRKELKVLALAANYGSALAGRDSNLSQRYIERIVNNPTRKEWEAEVKIAVKRGVSSFQSVFGTVITPEQTQAYRPGTPSWIPHVERCGINNPIQATASDLMIHSVLAASNILSRAKKSHIAYYKHDEGAFYIHDSEKELIDELKDITAYNVTENGRPWLPIHAEVEVGQSVSDSGPTVLDWR